MDNHDLKNFEFLKQIIGLNDILVDVGSNYGDYTDFFCAQLNGTGKIYSVELHPTTYSHLASKYESHKNVDVLNYGVCDVNSDIEYYAGKDAWTNNIIGHDMEFRKNHSLGKIKGIRLDELLKKEDRIKLVKIDVEGAEKLVLKGMKNIINNIDNILVECHLDEDWEEIKDIILNEYKMSCININSGESINENSNRAYQCFCKK
jgi:FkbM family methyltransferase